MGVLQVSEQGERFGLDLLGHGISAYPEYLISWLARPAGMMGEAAAAEALAAARLSTQRAT
jgi:hypothetical protein